ncbi:homoserine kinase [archaeon]|jgi:Ser/Thr protein kinase RdoA (MazF antagonist)|nr:homoserine kinase [archaeon]MBT4417410.1 homoserine kinase [archaeon]
MPPLTPLIKTDFENILKNYPLGEYKSHKHIDWALGNTVYLLKTTKLKYILKVCEQSGEDLLKFQIDVLNYLNKKGIPVAPVLKTKTKRNLIHYNGKPVLIQKFVSGKHPKKIDEELMKEITNLFGLMHKYLLRLKLKGKHTCLNHFKPSLDKVGTIPKINFRREEKDLIKQLKKLNQKYLRRCIIHSDLRDVNLLVENNKVQAIIDWDDAHEDYLAYDIGVFLLDPSVKNGRVDKKILKSFFKGYQKHVKLTDEEKKAVYYFIKARSLSTIAWCSRQIRVHKEHTARLKNIRLKMIKRYQVLNDFGVDNFLELF